MGPAGSGQLAKLVNNTLLAANMNNVQLVLALAEPLKLDLAALIDMLRTSSGSSFGLEALATKMTAQTAPHYKAMLDKDVRHFVEAGALRGLVLPEELRAAAKSGVEGIVPAVELIARASRTVS